MAKKTKRSPEQMHRQLQDQVQSLPLAIAAAEKEGKRGRALLLRFVTGPFVRFMNRMMNRQRYTGPEGGKLKQAEQMKRHLDQRQKAMEFYQGEMKKAQQKQAKRQGKRR